MRNRRQRLDDLLRRWGASAPTPVAVTPTSRVFRVRLADGRNAIVKDLTAIGVEDELRGADLLEWRAGNGYVRLLARDRATLLMQDAGAHSLLRAMAAALAPAVGRDSGTVLRWAFAHACLSACWHLEDGERAKAAGSLDVAAAVRSVLGSALLEGQVARGPS